MKAFWLTVCLMLPFASEVTAQNFNSEPSPPPLALDLPRDLRRFDFGPDSPWNKMKEQGTNAPTSTLSIMLLRKLPIEHQALPGPNWITALKAYNQADYATAQKVLMQLANFGNTYAMNLLGVMAEAGNGQPVDNVKALAYFYLAALYGFDTSDKQTQLLSLGVSDQQNADAKNMATNLAASFEVQPHFRDRITDPVLLKAGNVSFSRRVRNHAVFGFVYTRSLIGRNGKVLVVEAQDSMPEGYLEKDLVIARKNTTYKPQKDAIIQGTFVSSYFSPGVHVEKFTQLMTKNKLWELSNQANASAQFQLARLLHLAKGNSNAELHDFAGSHMSQIAPDFTVYNRDFTTHAVFPEFEGTAMVEIGKSGVVEKVNSIQFSRMKPDDLIGRSFGEGLPEGYYNLSKPRYSTKADQIMLTRIELVAASQTSIYWLARAAEGGYLPAQRLLSLNHNGWLSYLAKQQDPASMAWFGAQQIIDGDKAAGMANIDKAILLGYELGKELKESLQDY